MESNDRARVERMMHYYNAQIVNDSKRCARHKDYVFFSDPANANLIKDARDFYYQTYQDYYAPEFDRVYVVEIPERELKHLARIHEAAMGNESNHNNGSYARTVIMKEWAEHDIRSKYPAVQAAWEQYSLMLHLASNGKDPG
jgi:hypothetical protein